jgi:hypothetical protein
MCVALELTMGVIQNQDETMEDAVRRELNQNLTGIRAANLLDSARITDVQRIQDLSMDQSTNPKSGGETLLS